MKKFTGPLLLAAAALALAACSNAQSSSAAPSADSQTLSSKQASKTSAAPQADKDDNQAESESRSVVANTAVYPTQTVSEAADETAGINLGEDGCVMADNDQFSLKLTSIDKDGENFILCGTITSKLASRVTWQIKGAAINGIHSGMVSEGGTLDAGSIETFELQLPEGVSEFGEMQLVQFEVALTDTENDEVLFDEVISGFPYGESELYRAVYTDEMLKEQIYSDGTIEISLLISEFTDTRSLVNVCIKNLSEDVIEVSFSDFTYNETKLSPSFYLSAQTIFGLNEAIDIFYLIENDLEGSDLSLDALETLGMKISIQDLSNGSTLAENESIQIPLR